VVWTLERARLSWLAGDRAAATRDYQFVADVWQHADPALQPYVMEAHEALGQLAGDRALQERPVRARIGHPGALSTNR
jgi:hypothetical protein